MTGREYDLIRKKKRCCDAAVLAALPTLIARGTLALPSFVEDAGLFPGSAHHGRIIGPPPETGAEWQGLAVLYAAFSANRCLEALGSSKGIVIDGGFAANLPFARCLATLRPSQSVSVSQSRRTAAGARGAAVAEIFAHTSGFERGAQADGFSTARGEDGVRIPHPFRCLSGSLFRSTHHEYRNHPDLRQGIVDTCQEMNRNGLNQGDFRQSFAILNFEPC